MESTYRYPFSPYPTGWYLLRESVALGAGDVLPLRYFGRELVLYRTAGGEPVVVDAHCPHMGAHLGYGGTVDGEGIRCPFHAWHFDADGHCDDVPYSTAPNPPRVGLRCWPVHETSGLILVHFSEHGCAPGWQMPDRPEWDDPGWLGYETTGWTIRMHVQELVENVPDTAHFLYVHGVSAKPEARIEMDRHVYRQTMVIDVDGSDHEFLRQEAFGLGLVWLRVQGPPEYRFLTATTPIDDEHVELRLLFLVHEGEGATELSAGARAAIDATSLNTARDVPIWEHKVYREHAPLVPGDGPIGALRRWARQFYEV